MTGFPFGNLSGRWDDFLEIAGGDARYAAMLINRTAAGEPEEGLHPETLVDQDIRDGEAFMLAGRPIVPEGVYDLPRTVHGLYSELVDNVGRSGTLLRDWRGFPAGADADDVLRAIEAAFGETEYSRAGTVLGAYADDTFMSSFYLAQDAARDVTPFTPWEDEDGVAFLSRTLDAGAGATVPCLWYCRRDGEEGFEVGGVKLDCSNIGFDEVAAAAASNGLGSVLAYLKDSPRGLEPLCDIAVRRADGGQADAVKHFSNQDEAMAMLSAITGCRIQAYGADTLIYRASLGSSAAAKLAAGALAMKDRLSERGDAVEIGRRGGKCVDIAFVDADPAADDLHPTPVRAFTYNGCDEEPDHRTDVHLDGAMVLEGQTCAETPAHVPGDVATAAKEAAAKSAKADAAGKRGIKQ